jgi:hypothetical protein
MACVSETICTQLSAAYFDPDYPTFRLPATGLARVDCILKQLPAACVSRQWHETPQTVSRQPEREVTQGSPERTVRIAVLWDVTPHNLVDVCWRFGETLCLFFRVKERKLLILRTKTVLSFEASVEINQSARPHRPQDVVAMAICRARAECFK